MLRFAKLVDHPRKLYRMTGLTLDQFQTLTTRLTPLWEHAERTRLSQRPRRHAIGQGTKYKLATMAEKLCCLLVFYRFYLTDELLGWLVGLDASNVCRLQQRLEPLLEQAADPSLGLSLRRRLPPGVKKIGTWEKLLEVCPEFADVVTDATEQPRQRPPRRTQRRWYSGKRKRHTVKTQLSVSRARGRILHVSPSVPGRVHDYALFKRTRLAERLPPKTRLSLDRGYDGAATDYPTLTIALPVKRRRNHRVLTRAERAVNHLQARQRILVEHVLSRVKKYQVLVQVYRHRLTDYNRRFRNVAALTNFRLAPAVA
ncbi:MAG: transposase [Candidatus Omnitrophica bacterium]|nr:transposase [Candidatus Omnitrophota bacterium]